MQIFNTPNSIRIFQLRAAIAAIKLEAKGLRHSKRLNVKASWARHYNLSPRAKPEEVIAKLHEESVQLGFPG